MNFDFIAAQAVALTPVILKLVGESALKSVGTDIWVSIKKVFSKEKDKLIIESLEQNPDDPKLQGKVEMRLAQLLEEQPEVAKRLENLINKFQNENSKNESINISNSKNVFVNNSSNITGNVIIGDRGNYGR